MGSSDENQHGSLIAAMQEARELREAREGVEKHRPRRPEESTESKQKDPDARPEDDAARREAAKIRQDITRGTPLQQAEKFKAYQQARRRRRKRSRSGGESVDH
jgi:dsRNA-specific ribonuclease